MIHPTQLLAAGEGPNMFIPMILMLVLVYVLMIRPQAKRQKEHAARVAALKSGDSVITAGGIHGRITNVKEKSVIVKVADNVKIEFDKASISTVLGKDGASESSGGEPIAKDAPAKESSSS